METHVGFCFQHVASASDKGKMGSRRAPWRQTNRGGLFAGPPRPVSPLLSLKTSRDIGGAHPEDAEAERIL